eukprot:GHVU01128896.1.p1 GENE.GHVU01128896.1~~GHVU01128896.1.p1  ORF type:complete len:174 (+),score=3.25 GHVU01128896.1:390-911(+)
MRLMPPKSTHQEVPPISWSRGVETLSSDDSSVERSDTAESPRYLKSTRKVKTSKTNAYPGYVGSYQQVQKHGHVAPIVQTPGYHVEAPIQQFVPIHAHDLSPGIAPSHGHGHGHDNYVAPSGGIISSFFPSLGLLARGVLGAPGEVMSGYGELPQDNPAVVSRTRLIPRFGIL